MVVLSSDNPNCQNKGLSLEVVEAIRKQLTHQIRAFFIVYGQLAELHVQVPVDVEPEGTQGYVRTLVILRVVSKIKIMNHVD